jgi:hypothetical protein
LPTESQTKDKDSFELIAPISREFSVLNQSWSDLFCKGACSRKWEAFLYIYALESKIHSCFNKLLFHLLGRNWKKTQGQRDLSSQSKLTIAFRFRV